MQEPGEQVENGDAAKRSLRFSYHQHAATSRSVIDTQSGDMCESGRNGVDDESRSHEVPDICCRCKVQLLLKQLNVLAVEDYSSSYREPRIGT